MFQWLKQERTVLFLAARSVGGQVKSSVTLDIVRDLGPFHLVALPPRGLLSQGYFMFQNDCSLQIFTNRKDGQKLGKDMSFHFKDTSWKLPSVYLLKFHWTKVSHKRVEKCSPLFQVVMGKLRSRVLLLPSTYLCSPPPCSVLSAYSHTLNSAVPSRSQSLPTKSLCMCSSSLGHCPPAPQSTLRI